jgi:hypothetical protein
MKTRRRSRKNSKRIHWTQTPEGREKQRQNMLKQHANNRIDHEINNKEEVHISYIYGKIETIIEHYADSAGVSRATLARGVGSLLQRKESGKVLGS